MVKDFSKLTGRIVEKFGTRIAFCEALGKAPEWVSRRLKGQTEFTVDDIYALIDLLEIDPAEIHLYFFATKVR